VPVELVSETFAPHVGETFEAQLASGETLDLVLTECEETPYGEPDDLRERLGRMPFSLLFHSADRDRYAPQQTLTLRHPELGELELFVVPLGPDDRGMRYEAVVN
jgi:uncharacterized protein DUF6916